MDGCSAKASDAGTYLEGMAVSADDWVDMEVGQKVVFGARTVSCRRDKQLVLEFELVDKLPEANGKSGQRAPGARQRQKAARRARKAAAAAGSAAVAASAPDAAAPEGVAVEQRQVVQRASALHANMQEGAALKAAMRAEMLGSYQDPAAGRRRGQAARCRDCSGQWPA